MPLKTSKYIWHDGRLVPWEEATVHVLSHALHYGSSVFEGVRVYETRDAGATWSPRGDGLPQDHAYLTVLRRAFDQVGEGSSLELYFGATSGEVFGSGDAGASWATAALRLPPVYSVTAAPHRARSASAPSAPRPVHRDGQGFGPQPIRLLRRPAFAPRAPHACRHERHALPHRGPPRARLAATYPVLLAPCGSARWDRSA